MWFDAQYSPDNGTTWNEVSWLAELQALSEWLPALALVQVYSQASLDQLFRLQALPSRDAAAAPAGIGVQDMLQKNPFYYPSGPAPSGSIGAPETAGGAPAVESAAWSAYRSGNAQALQGLLGGVQYVYIFRRGESIYQGSQGPMGSRFTSTDPGPGGNTGLPWRGPGF